MASVVGLEDVVVHSTLMSRAVTLPIKRAIVADENQ